MPQQPQRQELPIGHLRGVGQRQGGQRIGARERGAPGFHLQLGQRQVSAQPGFYILHLLGGGQRRFGQPQAFGRRPKGALRQRGHSQAQAAQGAPRHQGRGRLGHQEGQFVRLARVPPQRQQPLQRVEGAQQRGRLVVPRRPLPGAPQVGQFNLRLGHHRERLRPK